MLDQPKNAIPCLCCLDPSAARMMISKINRPYVRCTRCNAMTYINSKEGLAGISLLAPQLMRLLDAWRTAGVQFGPAIDATQRQLDGMGKAAA